MSEEPSSLSGDVVPSGEGEWLSHEIAAERGRVKPKAIYRRIKRHPQLGRTNPETGEPEIWVPRKEELGSPARKIEEMTARSLVVPNQEERFLALLDRATASLGAQVQQLTEEREQANRERDEARSELAEARRQLAARDAVARAPWWRRLFGVE